VARWPVSFSRKRVFSVSRGVVLYSSIPAIVKRVVICANRATNSEGNYYGVYFILVFSLAIDVHQGSAFKRLCCRYQVSSKEFLIYRGRCLTLLKP
jgi:hypothetical protein